MMKEKIKKKANSHGKLQRTTELIVTYKATLRHSSERSSGSFQTK